MSRVISDGRKQLLKAPETQKRISEIRERIKKKYSAPIAEAEWFRKIALKIKMAREIEKAVDRIAPKGALYISDNKR